MNKSSCKLSISKREASDRKEAARVDFDLVRRCQKGDEKAFAQLVERYHRRVFAISLGMVKNQDDAMDIAQDAFIKVRRYIEGFQGASSFYTWLYRIVVNMCIDHLRKSGRQAEVEFDEGTGYDDELEESKPVVGSRSDANPSDVLSRKELAGRIQEAIDALPAYHRAVILMREIEGMSYSEMARALKVSKGTIMSRLHHARKKLQRALGDYVEEDTKAL